MGPDDRSGAHLLVVAILLLLDVPEQQELYVVDPTKHRREGENGGCDLVSEALQNVSSGLFISIGSVVLISGVWYLSHCVKSNQFFVHFR